MSSQAHDPTMRYDELLDRYLTYLADSASPRTVRTYTSILRRAQTETPKGVVTATDDELRQWIWRRDHDGDLELSGKTMETYLCAVRSLHHWLIEHGYNASGYDPTRLLPAPLVRKRLPKPTSDEETALLLSLSPQPWRTYLIIVAYTGARCCELAKLRLEHVDEQTVLLDGKGSAERRVPTHPAVLEAVERGIDPTEVNPKARPRLVAAQRDGWLCHLRNERTLSSLLGANMYRAAGVKGGPHRLRHWHATRALDGCGDIRVVQELLGHSSVATTQIYTRVNVSRLAGAVAGLPTFTAASVAAAPPAAPAAHPPS